MGMNKLFYIEFGEPQQSHMFSFGGGGSGVQPIYVVANDYQQASDKATLYLENYLKNDPEATSILDGDGSLKTRPDQKTPTPPQIISVKLLSNEIIY